MSVSSNKLKEAYETRKARSRTLTSEIGSKSSRDTRRVTRLKVRGPGRGKRWSRRQLKIHSDDKL